MGIHLRRSASAAVESTIPTAGILGDTRRQLKMIEDSTLALLLIFILVPLVSGAIWAWITRPRNYYYKLSGGVWQKKCLRYGSRKDH